MQEPRLSAVPCALAVVTLALICGEAGLGGVTARHALPISASVFGSSQSLKEREPVPKPAELQKILAVIREVYRDEYQGNKTTLARKLIKAAGETDQPAERFGLLQEALEAAIQAEQWNLAIDVIESLSEQYSVDGMQMKVDALRRLTRRPKLPAENKKALVESGLDMVETAVREETFAAAKEVCDMLLDLTRQSQDKQLRQKVLDRNDWAKKASRRFFEYRKALATLKETPDDGNANTVAGKYLCLTKGNWNEGLQSLGIGSDERWRAMAQKDMAGASATSEQCILGDQWWDLAEKEPELSQAVRKRAVYWYELALPQLTGLEKRRVLKRVDEVRGIAGQTQPRRSKVDGVVAASAKRESPQFLSEMEAFDVRRGPWPFISRAVILPNGERCEHSLQMHPPSSGYSSAKYRLESKSSTLVGSVVITRGSTGLPPMSPISFVVLGDGKVLWQSNPIQSLDSPQAFQANVRHVNQLELRVVCPGFNERAHAFFCDPQLLKVAAKSNPSRGEAVRLRSDGTPEEKVAAGYKYLQINGFSLLVHNAVLESQEVTLYQRKPLDVLQLELDMVVRDLPPKTIDCLRAVPIWVQWDMPSGIALARYIPGSKIGKRYVFTSLERAVKSNCIEILQMKSMTAEHQGDRHRCTMLHELTHAVHHHVFDFENPIIKAAYANAITKGLYSGRYAATNAKEYFAELSCAYFGHLNYYPYSREDLKTYDPVGYEMMTRTWGTPEDIEKAQRPEREKVAMTKLNMARKSLSNEKTRAAGEAMLTEIIRDYPNTRGAKDAKALLGNH